LRNLEFCNLQETPPGLIVKKVLAQEAYVPPGSHSSATSETHAPREKTSCMPSGVTTGYSL
jgi:hypothetical protein